MGKPFWRNVALIALAHGALIAVLIRWSLAARASSDPESIVWLGSAGDLAAAESPNEPSQRSERAAAPEPETSKDNKAQKQSPVVPANSEIELPSPPPTVTPVPKPTATPAEKSKATPKPVPKPVGNATHKVAGGPTPKKTSAAKASASKSNEKSAKKGRSAVAKSGPISPAAKGKAGSTAKVGSAGAGNAASEFAWYGNMLHDRFYSAWIQPTSNVPASAKISTLVRVRIEKDGRVSKFEITKPSENAVVNESVAAVAKQVTEVDSPPDALMKGGHYDVKINFELNTNEQTGQQ